MLGRMDGLTCCTEFMCSPEYIVDLPRKAGLHSYLTDCMEADKWHHCLNVFQTLRKNKPCFALKWHTQMDAVFCHVKGSQCIPWCQWHNWFAEQLCFWRHFPWMGLLELSWNRWADHASNPFWPLVCIAICWWQLVPSSFLPFFYPSSTLIGLW